MKRLLAVLALLVVGLLLARNLVAKVAVVQGVKAATGLAVKVGGMDLGLLGTHFGARQVTVLNPAGFPEPLMVALPELYVDYRLGSFLKGQPHLEAVRLHLAELVIIRNADGQVNINSLRPVQEQQQEAKAGAPARQAPPTIRIDRLDVKLGQVIFKDYTQPMPQVQEIDLNVEEHFEDITSTKALVSAVVMRALTRAGMSRLAGVDIGALKASAAQGLLGAATGALEGAVGQQGAAVLKSLLGIGAKDGSKSQ